ncbi:MAG: hypothetical protein ABI983_06240 [Acidobacteriota bacterium]
MIKERHALTAIVIALFAYVLVIRTYDVSSTFLMLGEQTRDWTVALGSITDLPLVGAPSTAGGRGFGPSYYWVLWIGRIVLGPFMDNLPHAGGVTVAVIQSIADVVLFIALSRRVHWSLALAICLLIASAPFDIAISSVIWNPPVSEAFIKIAIATALKLTPASPWWQVAVAAAFAWMGVQAHLSAIFVAAPLLAALALQSFVERPQNLRRTVVERAGVVLATVFFLQIPFLLSIFKEPHAPVGPSSAIASLTHPKVFRPWFAYWSVTGITGNLVWPMWDAFEYAIPTAIVVLIVAIVYRKDLVLIAVTAGAVVMATLLFTTSTRNFDGYWFLTLTPALTLAFGMAVAAIPSKTAVKVIGIALLLLVAWRQPARIEDSKRFFKYPQYEAMLKGSRSAVEQAPVVKDIKVAFDVHPTMDRQFIYKILGGRIDGSALYTAVINSDGSMRLQ